MIDLARIRQHLIDERERQDWTQAQLAERAGVRQGQISRLEDLSQPLSDLAARVLFRVIEDGFGFTLSSFFRQFEGQTKSDLPAKDNADKRDRAPAGSAKDAQQRRAVPVEASSLLAAGDALVEAGGRLIAAASGIEVGKSTRPPARVRAKKPAKNPRRAANS